MKWVKYVLASAMATPFFITTKLGFSQEIQRLPQVPGIDISRVEYVPAEKNRSHQLEQAIIRHFGEEVLDPQYPTEYSYNIVDLNDDGYPEALVFFPIYSRCSNSDNSCYQLGNRGEAIGYIISLLTEKGYYSSNNDNSLPFFDEQLEAAVKRFQRDHNLQPDGIVGLRTIELLCLPDEINSPNLSQDRQNQLRVEHRVCKRKLLHDYPENVN
ncbi:MAG: peptidoglycan-binding domain-containing protein [Oscillatoria sp. PMC 1051.18]|nr:peptidoglycan-binding domain-containing protein [Oscillatoria sp. PMC 1050.18]MEC5031814.1 peptidoglycan-binding domain-containing protein [Oscillatoria sp. PMC 1051.18]